MEKVASDTLLVSSANPIWFNYSNVNIYDNAGAADPVTEGNNATNWTLANLGTTTIQSSAAIAGSTGSYSIEVVIGDDGTGLFSVNYPGSGLVASTSYTIKADVYLDSATATDFIIALETGDEWQNGNQSNIVFS